MLIKIDDLQLLIVMHSSHMHVHVRRKLGLLRAVWALVPRLLAALKLAVRLHVRKSGVTTVASGTMKSFPHNWRGLTSHAVWPTGRCDWCHNRLMARRIVSIWVLLRLLHGIHIVPARLIRSCGYPARHYLGMNVR